MTTLDLRSILCRLLYNHPMLVAWLKNESVCNPYIASCQTVDFATQVTIECKVSSLAQMLFDSRMSFFAALHTGIPMPISIIYEDREIAFSDKKLLESLHQDVKEFTMVATLSQPATQQPTVESQRIIDLSKINPAIAAQVRERIVTLRLPVLPRTDGSYDVPEATFNLAWDAALEAIKQEGQAQSNSFVSPPSVPTPSPQSRSQKAERPPRKLPFRLMREKFTIEDIDLNKRSGSEKTFKTFFAKINFKSRTETEVLSSILAKDEYGQKLLDNFHKIYQKRDPLLDWESVEPKIMEAAREMLSIVKQIESPVIVIPKNSLNQEELAKEEIVNTLPDEAETYT